MKSIHKFPLTFNFHSKRFETKVPANSRFLDLQYRNSRDNPKSYPMIWCVVDTDVTEFVTLEYVIVGTGWNLDDYENIIKWNYLRTIQDGINVWHVFANPKNKVN